MVELVTPISHLFNDSDTASQISGLSDALECRDRSFDSDLPNQKLFHSDYQPIHRFNDYAFHYFEKIAKTKPELELVSFHVASCCDKPSLKNNMFYPGGKTYTRDEMCANAIENFNQIKNIFGENIEIAIENNNYYPTDAYKFITEPSFINLIAKECNLKILFDIAHAKVSCVNFKKEYTTYRDSLDLSRVIQLHVCRHGISQSNQLAYDAHDYPTNIEFMEVDYLTTMYPNIKYITIEYYKDFPNLKKSLDSFRELSVLKNK